MNTTHKKLFIALFFIPSTFAYTVQVESGLYSFEDYAFYSSKTEVELVVDDNAGAGAFPELPGLAELPHSSAPASTFLLSDFKHSLAQYNRAVLHRQRYLNKREFRREPKSFLHSSHIWHQSSKEDHHSIG